MKSGPSNVKTSCKAVKIIHGNTITVFKRAARREIIGKKNIIFSDMNTLNTINDAQLTNLTNNKITKNQQNTNTDSSNQHETNVNDTDMITDDAMPPEGILSSQKFFFEFVVQKEPKTKIQLKPTTNLHHDA